MAHPVCMHCLVSPPSSPVRTSNDELEHNARLFNSHRLRNHCSWPTRNSHLLQRHSHFPATGAPGGQW